MRILTQQLKEKTREVEEAQKPDPTFEGNTMPNCVICDAILTVSLFGKTLYMISINAQHLTYTMYPNNLIQNNDVFKSV